MDKPASRATPINWKWPKRMQAVGECLAVMYASNKWQRDESTIIDYKHNREAPQRLLVTPGFLRDYDRPSQELDLIGPMEELNRPMPDAFAALAKILGVQVNLYQGEDDDPELTEDGKNFYQVNIAGAYLGAAEHPVTKETFLIIYTKSGLHCVITGDSLNVEKDGIVG